VRPRTGVALGGRSESESESAETKSSRNGAKWRNSGAAVFPDYAGKTRRADARSRGGTAPKSRKKCDASEPGFWSAGSAQASPDDDFVQADAADTVIRRLDELYPADENGNRKVAINAVGFPTTIRYQFSMGNTGLRFSNLMRTVTYLHGGAFIALQDR
jgi:hypothetical protein